MHKQPTGINVKLVLFTIAAFLVSVLVNLVLSSSQYIISLTFLVYQQLCFCQCHLDSHLCQHLMAMPVDGSVLLWLACYTCSQLSEEVHSALKVVKYTQICRSQ